MPKEMGVTAQATSMPISTVVRACLTGMAAAGERPRAFRYGNGRSMRSQREERHGLLAFNNRERPLPLKGNHRVSSAPAVVCARHLRDEFVCDVAWAAPGEVYADRHRTPICHPICHGLSR
jgi:hypothetical protein